MSAPKEKCYFGCVPKDQLPGFLERLTKGIKEGKKSGDKKDFELEIRGSKDEPKGISIENFTFDKTKFGEFFDDSKDYMKKALIACTLNLEVKEEKDVDALKKVYDQAKPMFDAIPQIKEKPGKFDLQFRSSGKKVAIDLVTTEGKLVQPLLDLGIDLSEFHQFNFTLKSGIDLGKLFDEKADPTKNLADVCSILLSIKSSGENVKYLAGALGDAIKGVELKDEKLQKKKEKAVGFFNLINAFIGAKIKLEYDAQTLAGEGAKEAEKLGGAAGLQKQLSGYQQMVKGMGQQMVKPSLEAFGAIEPLKSTNIDTLSIAFGVPKYKNGCALVIKIPGLSKVVSDLLA